MFRKLSSLVKVATVALALGSTVAMVTNDAFARAGSGSNSGSRGSKTFSAPPATSTAPKSSQINKSTAQPGSASAAAAQQPSRFGGLKGLLLGGLLGAGLASLFGLGGMAPFFGFILQMLLFAGLGFLAYMAFMAFRNRSGNQPAMATANVGGGARPDTNMYRQAATSMGASAPALVISGDDYTAFERLLKAVQLGYANSDIKALERITTPEMLSYFAQELDQNAKRGLSNDLSEPRLLQGDLSESWREGTMEYATVAMRYEIIDATVETKTGRIVAGSTTDPQEVTEVWTFTRPANGHANQWELSAIQQA